MGKTTRQFDGHLHPDDPRYIITGAGGCTWPTIPAYRYLCVSENATGPWAFLNYFGVLFQQSGGAHLHDDISYVAQDIPFPATWATLRREYFRTQDIVRWSIVIMQVTCYFPAHLEVQKAPGPGNGIITLGSMTCVGGPGETGSNMRLLPVEYDDTVPPGGWPPT